MSENVQLAITYCDPGNPTELYDRVDARPQQVEIRLDLEHHELGIRTHPEPGGRTVSGRAWHGIVRTWSLPVILTSVAANTLLEQIAADCAQIIEESAVFFDGSNHVGQLTPRGHELEEEVRQRIENYAHDASTGRVEVLDVDDVLADTSLDQVLKDLGAEITCETSHERLAVLADEIDYSIDLPNPASVAVVEGMYERLIEHRDELRDDERNRLVEDRDMIAVLKAQRDQRIRRIHGWGAGDTDRSLEMLAGVSRTTVARIRKPRSEANGWISIERVRAERLDLERRILDAVTAAGIDSDRVKRKSDGVYYLRSDSGDAIAFAEDEGRWTATRQSDDYKLYEGPEITELAEALAQSL